MSVQFFHPACGGRKKLRPSPPRKEEEEGRRRARRPIGRLSQLDLRNHSVKRVREKRDQRGDQFLRDAVCAKWLVERKRKVGGEVRLKCTNQSASIELVQAKSRSLAGTAAKTPTRPKKVSTSARFALCNFLCRYSRRMQMYNVRWMGKVKVRSDQDIDSLNSR